MAYVWKISLLCSIFVAVHSASFQASFIPKPAQDAIIPERKEISPQCDGMVYTYKYVEYGGAVHDTPGTDFLEVSATPLVSVADHQYGAELVARMVMNMPSHIFVELSQRGSVGLFTWAEGTTSFPEYCHLKDRPECAGTCAGACSDTCTSDGRKYDELAGVGGARATCVDANYMCTVEDTYGGTFLVLAHEFAHTVHQYSVYYVEPNVWDQVYTAWENALSSGVWDGSSYAMSNHLEYFAEGSATFFNVNNHYSSSGGMNSCGKPQGEYCDSEVDARAWLSSQDPDLYNAIALTFTDNQDQLASGMTICPARRLFYPI